MANGLRSVRCRRRRRRGHGRRIRRLRQMDGRTAPQLIRISVGALVDRKQAAPIVQFFDQLNWIEEITLCWRQIYLLFGVLTLPDYL